MKKTAKYSLVLLLISGGISLVSNPPPIGDKHEASIIPTVSFTDAMPADKNNLVQQTVCVTPLTLDIGQVDKEFKLSHEEVVAALKKATQEWQDATGKKWFIVHSGGTLKVNFLFDGRQSSLDQMEEEQSQIKQESERLLTSNRPSEREASEFLNRVDSYRRKYESTNVPVPWAQHHTGQAGSSIDIFAFSNLEELHATLLHELGHAIGLGHLPQQESIMFALRIPGRSDIHLSQYDIEAALSLC